MWLYARPANETSKFTCGVTNKGISYLISGGNCINKYKLIHLLFFTSQQHNNFIYMRFFLPLFWLCFSTSPFYIGLYSNNARMIHVPSTILQLIFMCLDYITLLLVVKFPISQYNVCAVYSLWGCMFFLQLMVIVNEVIIKIKIRNLLFQNAISR